MPTPARGPQKPPLEKGASLSFLRRRIHAIAGSRALRLDGRATRERAKQHRTSPVLAKHVAEAVEAEGSLASSAAVQCPPLHERRSPGRRLGASCSRRWSRQQNMGIRGLPWHVPCHVRCKCCLVRRRMLGLGCVSYDGYRAAAGNPAAVGYPCPYLQMPLRDTVPLWDTMPLRDPVLLRDTVPLWDTVPLHGVGYDGQQEACSARRAT
jgi:hypothetical protein